MTRKFLRKLISAVALVALAATAHAGTSATYNFRVFTKGVKPAAVPQPSTDPFFASVVSLLPLSTPTGGSAVTDVKGGAWSGANVAMSAAQFKVGSGALSFSTASSTATGPVVNMPGDFTVEAWIFPFSTSGAQPLVTQWSQATPSSGAWGLMLSSGALSFSFGPYSIYNAMMGGGSIPANAWTHVAVSRQGQAFRLFVNGAVVATASTSAPGLNISVPVVLGNYIGFNGQLPASGATNFQGYMQQVRMTVGVARYTSPFTPSTTEDPTQ